MIWIMFTTYEIWYSSVNVAPKHLLHFFARSSTYVLQLSSGKQNFKLVIYSLKNFFVENSRILKVKKYSFRCLASTPVQQYTENELTPIDIFTKTPTITQHKNDEFLKLLPSVLLAFVTQNAYPKYWNTWNISGQRVLDFGNKRHYIHEEQLK